MPKINTEAQLKAIRGLDKLHEGEKDDADDKDMVDDKDDAEDKADEKDVKEGKKPVKESKKKVKEEDEDADDSEDDKEMDNDEDDSEDDEDDVKEGKKGGKKPVKESKKKVKEEDEDDSDDEDAEDDDAEDDDEKDDLKESFGTHFKAIFEGTELSEESIGNLSILFESAIGAEVNKRVKAATKRLQEEKELEVAAAKAELEEQADQYLTYAVNEWAEKNRVALRHSVKVDIMESFIGGLRNLFLEHNFNIPEGDIAKVDEQAEEISTLKAKLAESVKEAAKVEQALDEAQRKIAFTELTEGMSTLDKEKMRELVEGKTYTSAEAFAKGAAIIKEGYFTKKALKMVAEEAPIIAEAVEDAHKKKVVTDDYMARLAAMMR
nr:MAG TPA: Scaffold protein [Caudoviricetes sp.]